MKKYIHAENIQLVFSGNNYFQLLEHIINNAKEVLHLQTYIFESDETGMRIVRALEEAVRRGVKVFVLVDAFGSNSFDRKVIRDMVSKGIHFRKYSPLFSSESIYFYRRLHYKIIVADKHIALTGGINIANKYNDSTKEEPWLDYAILTEGTPCEYLHILCERTYLKKTRNVLANWERSVIPGAGEKLIRFRINDFVRGMNEIHEGYKQQIKNARQSVILVASYFLPGYGFRKLLAEAAARQVNIKIILAGHSDVSSAKLAQSYLYDFLLKNNIELYEWRNSVLHGKAMIVDHQWATVGSYNLNFLSRYISIELNSDIIDPGFISTFSAHIHHILESACMRVKLDDHIKKTNIFSRLNRWLAYIFFRTLMTLTVHKRIKKKKWIH